MAKPSALSVSAHQPLPDNPEYVKVDKQAVATSWTGSLQLVVVAAMAVLFVLAVLLVLAGLTYWLVTRG